MLLINQQNKDPMCCKVSKNILSNGNLKSDLYIKANVAKMEAAADFNGVIIQSTYTDPVTKLSFLLNHISLPYAIPYELLVPSEQGITSTPFKKFKANFLRANIAEGGKTWLLEDAQRDIFVHNCGMTARLAKNSYLTGIFIDAEAYGGSIFWKYEALAALHPTAYTFQDYQSKYYETGLLVGQGIAKEFPTIKLLIAISYEQLRSVTAAQLPANKYGLLPSFLNGLHEGVGNDARIVNTLEDGYANRVEADFDYDLNVQIAKNVPYLNSVKYPTVHVHGMSTWCDYPGTAFNFQDPSKNYNTPEKFEANLEMALKRVDWVVSYCEQINWQAPTVGVNAPPAPYLAALSRVAVKYGVV